MSLLPGVPNMGPAPVSTAAAGPTLRTPGSTGMGKPSGIAAIAAGVGKPGSTQHLGNLAGRSGKGISAITGGSPAQHMGNHYGKTAPALLGGQQMPGGVDPTAHAGANMIRGGSGAMRSHIRAGGLGPGPMSTAGDSTNYSMNNPDQE